MRGGVDPVGRPAEQAHDPGARRVDVDSTPRQRLHVVQDQALAVLAHAELPQQLQHHAQMADDEPVAAHAGALQSGTGQLQDLGVRGWAGRTDQLDSDLGELPVAGPGWSLVAEAHPAVVEPHRQAPSVKLRDVGAHDARGQLGPKAEPSIPVREGVHAGDQRVARLAQEELERLDDGRLDARVPKRLEAGAQLRLELAQARVGGRQVVVGAADALDRRRPGRPASTAGAFGLVTSKV